MAHISRCKHGMMMATCNECFPKTAWKEEWDKGCKMKQHKWHKEIKAWAEGEEIECRFLYAQVEQKWQVTNAPRFEDPQWEFRIKPQPKDEKQKYLYVYRGSPGGIIFTEELAMGWDGRKLLGKIKLENDDE